jgi:hypothetical protein
MIRQRSGDPINNLARRDRRQWRALEKRVRREHELAQMATLNGLAAAGLGVTGMSNEMSVLGESALGTPVEFIIDGRRVRIGRTHRPTLTKLREGLSRAAALPLVRVARYGSYWVLTFRVATGQLVLLAEHLTLLPEGGGYGGLDRTPAGPLSGVGA